MVIQFFSEFAKKYNSTKRPVGAVDRSLTGHLKQPCSIMKPIINIERLPQDANPCVYTYAIIPAFQRFYFVEDWIWNNGLWEVHMTEDVLGTWKTQIGNQTMYVLRADTRDTQAVMLWNGGITDTTYPATTDFDIERTSFDSPFVSTESSGVYVVGVVGSDNADAMGAITYYAMTSSEFGDLKATLFGIDGLKVMGLVDTNDQWTATDMGEQIFKTMYNPFQYIVSCNWFPISPSSIAGTPVTTMKIGWWIYTVTAKRISQKIGTFYDEIKAIPPHPQAGTRGRYLNFAPYTKRTLYGKFGSIPLDTAFFDLDESSSTYYRYLVGKYTVDYVTGQCLYQIYTARYTDHSDLQLIHKTEFLLGVPIQLAQIGMDYMGTVSTALNSVGGTVHNALTGALSMGGAGLAVGALGGVASGIYDSIQSAMPQLETSGSNGSFINIGLNTQLISIYYTITYEDIEHKGRTVCLPVQISLLNGFVMCADGEIDITCFDNERKEIARLLTTGFFWE